MSPRPPTRPVPPTGDDDLGRVLLSLESEGFEEVEVYAKSGRSRRYTRFPLGPDRSGHDVATSEEKGWAARAGAGAVSLFYAATGEPRPQRAWPEAMPGALLLPEPVRAAPLEGSGHLDAPMLAEREGLGLLSGIARELESELPGARLSHARLDDGASESRLRSSRGVDACWRLRLAALELEAVGPGGETAHLAASAPHGRALTPGALARRLADQLATAAGQPPERDRGSFLLAPAAAARLVAGLLPLVVGEGAEARAGRLADRAGKLGSELWTVIDDGRFPGAPLASAVDGEGIPTRRQVLIDAGGFRRSLTARRPGAPAAGTGAVRRPSWRHPPTAGPSQLYLAPDAAVSTASLLRDVARGYYLLDAPGPGHFDLVGDTFSLPVRGFRIESGRAERAVAHAELTGAVSALLRGLKAKGRDLSFFPLAGLIGSPSLLLTGLEILPRRAG